MRIQHNIMAMNAYRNYNTNTSALSKNLEKLSSGYKINRAGDDAAGLAISEKMRAQISGLNAASKNVKDGISLVKTAEGAMQEIQDMLNRMKYLATQSANGTYDEDVDRFNLQKEVDSLCSEINRIADSANFNGINLLDGKMGFGASGAGSAPTAPTATVDTANNAAGVKAVTVAFGDKATAADKTAINTALEGKNITITTTDASGDAKFEATDKIKVEGFTVPTGYTATFKDANGKDAAFTVGSDITVGTNDGDLGVGSNLEITLKNADGGVAGTITIDLSTAKDNGANGATATKVAFAKAAAAGGAGGAAGATAKKSYTSKVTGDDGTNKLVVNDTIKIGGKTYTMVADATAVGGDATKIAVDTNNTFEKQIQAAITEYNKANDEDFTAAYKDGTLTFTAKDGKTPTAAPTFTIGDAATKIAAGTVEEAKNTTGAGAGNGTLILQIGDTSDTFNQLTVKVGDMHTSALGLRKGTADKDDNGNKTGTYTYDDVADGQSIADIDIGTLPGAQKAIDVIKGAINYVSSVRGDLGATQNRLEHTANNLSVMTENIQDAESTIRDTDVAEEMMAYTKNNILIQSAQAMLAQANQVPQGVLQLLG